MRIYSSKAIRFFGGVKETAEAMKLTPVAIRSWSRLLSPKLSAQVLGFALLTRGITNTKAGFPDAFKAPKKSKTA